MRAFMRGPDVPNVSLRRMASKMASRVFSSAHTPASPDALYLPADSLRRMLGFTAPGGKLFSDTTPSQLSAPSGGTECRISGLDPSWGNLPVKFFSSKDPAPICVSLEPMKPNL